jgi:hypothetical protein
MVQIEPLWEDYLSLLARALYLAPDSLCTTLAHATALSLAERRSFRRSEKVYVSERERRRGIRKYNTMKSPAKIAFFHFHFHEDKLPFVWFSAHPGPAHASIRYRVFVCDFERTPHPRGVILYSQRPTGKINFHWNEWDAPAAADDHRDFWHVGGFLNDTNEWMKRALSNDGIFPISSWSVSLSCFGLYTPPTFFLAIRYIYIYAELEFKALSNTLNSHVLSVDTGRSDAERFKLTRNILASYFFLQNERLIMEGPLALYNSNSNLMTYKSCNLLFSVFILKICSHSI